jgi:peptidoglycan/xylan/chitin deacetylase (PgdA/CDA1 family)
MTGNRSQDRPTTLSGNPGRTRVLMYHRILQDNMPGPQHQYWLSQKEFRRQMRFLVRHGFTSMTFEEYWLYKNGQFCLPRKPVILTFDDAYVDTYAIAFPILRELGLKAVIFAVADPDIHTSIWDSDVAGGVAPLMSTNQLREMRKAGFEIGSHGLHHKALSLLAPQEAWVEISRSRAILESAIQASVQTFCYPYGSLNVSVKKMVRDAGYRMGVSAWAGPARFGRDDYQIRRIAVVKKSHFAIAQFAVSLMQAYQVYRWLWWRIRELLESLHPGNHHNLGMTH